MRRKPTDPSPLSDTTVYDNLPNRRQFPAFFPIRILPLSTWAGVVVALWLSGCRKEEQRDFIPNTGQIQVLNGCGKPGAAEQFRNYLSDLGFDVIEFGNAEMWNYERTLVVARTESATIAEDLAKTLHTKNLVHLADTLAMVDATVFVGKDYEELMKRWRNPE